MQGSARILVVDDDPDVVDLVGYVLSGAGYEVVTASDAREALRRCFQSVMDLVILDLMMPGMSGLAVMRGMRRLFAHRAPPVIIFTGFPHLSREAIRLGARALLQKPCDIDGLLSLVRDTLEQRPTLGQ